MMRRGYISWVLAFFIWLGLGNVLLVQAEKQSKGDSLRIKVNALNQVQPKLDLYEQLFDYWIYKSYDSASVYANHYYALARESENRRAESTGANLLGLIYDYQGNYAKAKEYYLEALTIRKALGDQKLVANSLSNLGVMYYYAANYDKAADYYFQAIKIREQIADSAGLGQSYNNLGVLMRHQEEYGKAIHYYDKAAAIKQSTGDEKSMLATLLNIGALHTHMANFKEAVTYAEQALPLAEKYGEKVSEAQLYLNLGEAQTGLGNYQDAEQKIRRGIAQLKSIGEKGLEFEGYNILIHNYLSFRRAGLALDVVSAVEQRRNEIPELDVLHTFHGLAAKTYAENGFFEKAYRHRGEENQLQDSLYRKSSRDALLELETKYSVEQKESELELLKKDNQLQQASIAKNKMFRNSLLILFLVVSVAFAVVYHNYRKRMAMNERLNRQNRIIQDNLAEKELLIREIHHRVKNNLQVVSSLLNLQSRRADDKPVTEALQTTRQRIQTIALVHHELYSHNNIGNVEIPQYFSRLAQNILSGMGAEERITLNMDVAPVTLDPDTSLSLALILNELLTNAIKYAFGDTGKGTVTIKLHESADKLSFSISDDGNVRNTQNTNGSRTSFGMDMVKTLADKLQTGLETDYRAGTTVTLIINQKAEPDEFH